MTPSEGVVTRLTVSPDYTADPVWQDTAMVDLDSLPLSGALISALRGWAREWETLMGVQVARYEVDDVVAHEAWQRRGRELTRRLQRELGKTYVVDYTA